MLRQLSPAVAYPAQASALQPPPEKDRRPPRSSCTCCNRTRDAIGPRSHTKPKQWRVYGGRHHVVRGRRMNVVSFRPWTPLGDFRPPGPLLSPPSIISKPATGPKFDPLNVLQNCDRLVSVELLNIFKFGLFRRKIHISLYSRLAATSVHRNKAFQDTAAANRRKWA